MIELTNEMVQLAVDTFLFAPGRTIREIDTNMREALTAVLALVERDLSGPCGATLPRLAKHGDLWCQLRHGHAGDHEMGPTRWKGRVTRTADQDGVS